jgi:hypothetical protein
MTNDNGKVKESCVHIAKTPLTRAPDFNKTYRLKRFILSAVSSSEAAAATSSSREASIPCCDGWRRKDCWHRSGRREILALIGGCIL